MNIPLEKTVNPASPRRAFTLVELLVVISIIGILAALIIPVAGSVSRIKKINTAQAELQQVETALENYKAKYGSYPPSCPSGSTINQLYYELSGVTNNGTSYITLDSASTVKITDFTNQFGVGGIVNCSKGSGEDTAYAEDFLTGLKPTQFIAATNINQIWFNYLVTSVGGPDLTYQPIPGSIGNPFRYLYPGTNNPSSYDLWIQLSIGTTTNTSTHTSNPKFYLISNWTRQVMRNYPLP